MFVRGLLTPEAEGLAIVRTPNCSLAILLSVVGIWHMALTTGVDVAARPGEAELERWVRSPSMPAGLVMRCGSCWPPSTGTIAAGCTHPPG